jgi:hypothetical protein
MGFQHSSYRGVLRKELPCANCNDLYPRRILCASGMGEPRISIKTHLNRVLMGHKGDRHRGEWPKICGGELGTDVKSLNERARHPLLLWF